MKKIVQVISLALCLCWLFILSGCTAGYASVEKRSTDLSRFIEVEHEHDKGWSVVSMQNYMKLFNFYEILTKLYKTVMLHDHKRSILKSN